MLLTCMKTRERHTNTKSGQMGGTTLVELMVYITILTIVSVALIAAVNSIFSTLAELRVREEIAQTGVVTLERITREIRKASDIDVFSSTLGSSPGILVLDTEDSSGNPTTMTIEVTGGKVTLQEGIGVLVPLSRTGVTVDSLIFTRMSGTNTEGVLVELTVSKDIRGTTITKEYRTFAVLKG